MNEQKTETSSHKPLIDLDKVNSTSQVTTAKVFGLDDIT